MLRMRNILLFFFLISFVVIGKADDAAVEKYKDFLPEELLALSKEERYNSVPMSLSSAARLGVGNEAELIISSMLNNLMYTGIGDYGRAIKAFQKDLGEKETGKLTVSQIWKLSKRSEYVGISPISFPSGFFDRMSEKEDYATVHGTMKILDERIAYPVNYLELKCYKNDGYCEMTQYSLALPEEGGWSASYVVLRPNRTFYNITRWSGKIVEAVPSTSSNEDCRLNSISLNFETHEHFDITRNGTKDCEVMGTKIPKLEKPRIAQIVNGQDIFQKEFNAIKDKGYKFLSSEYRTSLEKVIKESEKDN